MASVSGWVDHSYPQFYTWSEWCGNRSGQEGMASEHPHNIRTVHRPLPAHDGPGVLPEWAVGRSHVQPFLSPLSDQQGVLRLLWVGDGGGLPRELRLQPGRHRVAKRSRRVRRWVSRLPERPSPDVQRPRDGRGPGLLSERAGHGGQRPGHRVPACRNGAYQPGEPGVHARHQGYSCDRRRPGAHGRRLQRATHPWKRRGVRHGEGVVHRWVRRDQQRRRGNPARNPHAGYNGTLVCVVVRRRSRGVPTVCPGLFPTAAPSWSTPTTP